MQTATLAIGLKDSDCCNRWARKIVAMKSCLDDEIVEDLQYEAE